MKKTLRSKKIAATKKEFERVYDYYNLPPRDIIVTHDGVTFLKKAWVNGKNFGWDKWKKKY